MADTTKAFLVEITNTLGAGDIVSSRLKYANLSYSMREDPPTYIAIIITSESHSFSYRKPKAPGELQLPYVTPTMVTEGPFT